ncbi:unnamed protein product [Effrenium voratum]|uniref:Uncharacterized protein n=1 Tax=Effrenium voratum TaxID=2562239 RepID=A0AA36N9Z6_9DINO|nr:unnamed protein product [Effrenium voratum]
MAMWRLALALFGAVHADVIQAPLQREKLTVDLGLQMSAERHPRGAGSVSVPLTRAEGPAGPGLQMSARGREAGLGPQLDARITPGKPKLRQAEPVLPWTFFLRCSFCLMGLALVYLATVQQEAEQGRMARLKKMLSMLIPRKAM